MCREVSCEGATVRARYVNGFNNSQTIAIGVNVRARYVNCLNNSQTIAIGVNVPDLANKTCEVVSLGGAHWV